MTQLEARWEPRLTFDEDCVMPRLERDECHDTLFYFKLLLDLTVLYNKTHHEKHATFFEIILKMYSLDDCITRIVDEISTDLASGNLKDSSFKVLCYTGIVDGFPSEFRDLIKHAKIIDEKRVDDHFSLWVLYMIIFSGAINFFFTENFDEKISLDFIKVVSVTQDVPNFIKDLPYMISQAHGVIDFLKFKTRELESTLAKEEFFVRLVSYLSIKAKSS